MFQSRMDVEKRVRWFEMGLHVEDSRRSDLLTLESSYVQIDGLGFANDPPEFYIWVEVV